MFVDEVRFDERLPATDGMAIAYRLKRGRRYFSGRWDAGRQTVVSTRGMLEERAELAGWVERKGDADAKG